MSHSPTYRQFVPYKEVYTEEELARIQNEFSRLEGTHYLDHAGSSLYASSQIEEYNRTLLGNVFGNPHSRNPSSTFTADAIDGIRLRILAHFGTDGDSYSVIFTSGATSALKMLAEAFTFNGGPFVYTEENHTSVVGMREIVGKWKDCPPCSGIYAIPAKILGELLDKEPEPEKLKRMNDGRTNALMAYPAQCNFSGFKYPLDWIQKIQDGWLEHGISPQFEINQVENGKGLDRWYVLLDAASFAASNELNLSQFPADFVVVSFYKMFGFPTGLGALLVRKESESVLRKRYVGGGTVEVLIPSTPFHSDRKELHQRFEDGTLDFLSILSLGPGLDTWLRLGVSLDKISLRTFHLARYAFQVLSEIKYKNGQPVARIYSLTKYESVHSSGPVLTFNLVREDGTFIGYSEVEEIAFLHKIHLRYGCFCNPGACRRFLGYEPQDLMLHFAAGHVCGDMRDMVEGRPTGAVRASFGYMTQKGDVDALLDLIHSTWVERGKRQERRSIPLATHLHSNVRLQRIFIYPIKSCAALEVSGSWPLGRGGLLFDREWLICNSLGVPLTQKRKPALVKILPSLDLSNRRLWISASGVSPISVSLEIKTNGTTEEGKLCSSKVCGEKVVGFNCGKDVSDWLSHFLDQPGLKLIRLLPQGERLSLANDSQFVLVSSGSLLSLASELESQGTTYSDSENEEETETNSIKKSVRNLVRRFRPNFVVSGEIPYEEENWNSMQIRNCTFKSGGPCTRCGTVCLDQKTGATSTEPLRTLAAKFNGSPKFGIRLSLEEDQSVGIKSVSVGDSVSVLSHETQIPHFHHSQTEPKGRVSVSSCFYQNLTHINAID